MQKTVQSFETFFAKNCFIAVFWIYWDPEMENNMVRRPLHYGWATIFDKNSSMTGQNSTNF